MAVPPIDRGRNTRERQGRRLVGYWIGREFWGKGLATRALQELTREVTQRPLQAWVATSNVTSIRVLEKCGFVRVGSQENDVEELLFELRDGLQRAQLDTAAIPAHSASREPSRRCVVAAAFFSCAGLRKTNVPKGRAPPRGVGTMTRPGATGPEHRARAIARRWHHVTPRKLAKKAGVTIEIAKMIIDEEQRRRAA